jgi:aminocarboxymuconate-semialdehyde decarboxylase
MKGKAMSVIDSDVHLIQRADDSDIRALMGKPYSNDSYPVFPGTGWDASSCGEAGAGEWDTQAQLTAMDREGIDLSIVMPTQGLLVSQIPKAGLPTGFPRQIRDKKLAATYCRAYNDHVANICAGSPRLKAVGIASFQDVGAAIAEVRRAVEQLGLVGIVVSSLGLTEHLGSPTFWPIYDELEKLNRPLIVHNLAHQVPVWQRYPDSFLFQETVGGSMETLHAFTGLMYGGIPEKFSKLRIAFFDIGTGWIPYMLERMDKDFASHGAEQAPLLKQSPSAYVKLGSWYYSTPGDEGTLAYVLDCIGDNGVVVGSSYPEADSAFPTAFSSLKARGDISEESKRKILSDNAQRLFGLQ